MSTGSPSVGIFRAGAQGRGEGGGRSRRIFAHLCPLHFPDRIGASIIIQPFANVKEHATLSAVARGDHGVEVECKMGMKTGRLIGVACLDLLCFLELFFWWQERAHPVKMTITELRVVEMRTEINLDPLPMRSKEIHFAFNHGQSRLSDVGSG